jgi:Tol biopolymer transport system component
VVDVTTGAETQLTTETSNEIHPFWHPDSNKLVYQSDRDGIWQIYELDLTTSPYTETLLSDGAGDDHDPAYSNDGEQIAFRSYRDGENSVVYVMDADGSNLLQISDPAGDALNQVFSPDDSLVAYESDLDGDKDIYVYEFETEQTRLLTDNTTEDVAPTWYCESTTIVWTSNATEDKDVGADNNIFSVNSLPIDAPPIDVKAEASQLTSDPAVDQYPQDVPAIENASRAGQVPGLVRNR